MFNVLCIILSIIFIGKSDGHILRTPCSWDGEFEEREGKRYSAEHVIFTVSTSEWSDCTTYCVANVNCTLANYNKVTSTCELIQDRLAHNPTKVKADDDWSILSTKYGSRYRGMYCRLVKPCDVFQICEDTCIYPYYACLTLNNIALLKSAYQSSDYSSSYTADFGVDGDFSTLTWTQEDLNPWWYVDLGEIVEVQFVTVFSGGVPFPTKVSIGMDNTNPKKNTLCATIEAELTERRSYECLDGILVGQYVYLYSDNGERAALYFYQLEVYID